jgi:hypothetical protein
LADDAGVKMLGYCLSSLAELESLGSQLAAGSPWHLPK